MNYNMPNRDERDKDLSGFVIYEKLEDRYGATVLVKESSIAFEPCVWIIANSNSTDYPNPSPHLTPDQAKMVADALYKFVEDSKLEDPIDEEES